MSRLSFFSPLKSRLQHRTNGFDLNLW